jgi:S1-C subfamily serine protease
VTNGNWVTPGHGQTSAPINPGNSGGALVNTQGIDRHPTLGAVDPTQAAANGIGL